MLMTVNDGEELPTHTSCPSSYTLGVFGCLRLVIDLRDGCMGYKKCMKEGASLPSPRSHKAFQNLKIQLEEMAGKELHGRVKCLVYIRETWRFLKA